jgi:hypothetical protein
MDVDTKPDAARKPKKAFTPKLNKVFIKNLTPDTTSEIRDLYTSSFMRPRSLEPNSRH